MYCPKNGIGKTHKRWERLRKTLEAKGLSFDFVQSESADSVERLMTMLIRNGYKTIIIVGGDSALSTAVNCLMNEEKQVRDEVALGVIPHGVINDFAHFWGFYEDNDEQTIDWLKKHRTRKIDLGHICYENKKGEQVSRYFLNCVNIGLSADIMNLRRQARQVLGSRRLAFLSSLVLMMFHRHDYKMRLNINYETVERQVMTVCVGNAHGYGQTPSAVPYNGMMDVSVVYNPKVKQLFEGLWLLLTGRFLNHRSVHPYRTQEIVCESSKALVSLDGGAAERTVGEYRLKVEQEVINFLIPD